ncbi:hypothetical protein E2C01_057665 [Portunus trituberculatus]|uniref:Uncharacterized protein n=1 Tax=Portunus trituberculatus TaxID=210409 RepID=A0A5B7H141_PORTR|nr:hypothetical protein [Portunus trituberculatus]
MSHVPGGGGGRGQRVWLCQGGTSSGFKSVRGASAKVTLTCDNNANNNILTPLHLPLHTPGCQTPSNCQSQGVPRDSPSSSKRVVPGRGS